ncbi:bifunctional riboflavin kinase/FAD synthetase [Desulfovibrio inopinatus]|uniref:bifunctional riboflavin kinase/FAD synthetase n=1 Tax=Desulfovibrio inopinatus TaxID=102109 RepID=UPI000427DF19|nr:bifunctional riboflavin kinase/FAD synthetase [Desulfovibrio inopinatus]
MIVASSIDEISEALCETSLTIGNFDGVHMGHAKLLSRTRLKAEINNRISVALTFEPHPRRVILGKNDPPLITPTPQKLELIEALGINITVVLPFTKEIAAHTPEAFVKKFLVDGFKVKDLVIGYDYAFGRGRKGNYELLSALGAQYGYVVERLDPVILDGAVVSSTRIRDLVEAGNVWDARPLLNRFYQVRGEVVRGFGRGSKLVGFPTANLHLVDELVPKHGVYAVWVQADGQTYSGVANIGHNPTFGNAVAGVEAHIFDFKGDLYGKTIRVHFVQRIRDERKFSGVEELTARIREDAALARRILSMPEARL